MWMGQQSRGSFPSRTFSSQLARTAVEIGNSVDCEQFVHAAEAVPLEVSRGT